MKRMRYPDDNGHSHLARSHQSLPAAEVEQKDITERKWFCSAAASVQQVV